MTIIELGKRFSELKQEHADQAAKLKAVEAEWTEVETQLIDAMVDEGVNSISIAGVGAISMRTENYFSVTAVNQEGFYKYLKSSGNNALLKESVNPQTLKAWLKQHFVDVQVRYQETEGLDEVEARNAATKFLNEKGASSFTKRGLALKSAN